MHISKIFQKLNNQTIVGNVKISGMQRIIMLYTLHVKLRATETLISVTAMQKEQSNTFMLVYACFNSINKF